MKIIIVEMYNTNIQKIDHYLVIFNIISSQYEDHLCRNVQYLAHHSTAAKRERRTEALAGHEKI